MRFDKIVIVGSGKIACDIVGLLSKEIFLTNLVVIESKRNSLSFLEKICIRKGVRYIYLLDTDKLEKCLKIETLNNQSVLIISANNQHIFSKELLINSKFEVINFHYSYLPNYRGMNIPTWVIYNQEPYTGITWHYVTEIIDAGEIIARKKIFLTDDITAFDVTRLGMKLGIETFKEFVFDLLEEHIDGIKINEGELGTFYSNNKLPENGYLKLNESCANIYKILRCYDYGKGNILLPLTVAYKDREYYVKHYEKISNDCTSNESINDIVIKGNEFSLKITIAEKK